MNARLELESVVDVFGSFASISLSEVVSRDNKIEFLSSTKVGSEQVFRILNLFRTTVTCGALKPPEWH